LSGLQEIKGFGISPSLTEFAKQAKKGFGLSSVFENIHNFSIGNRSKIICKLLMNTQVEVLKKKPGMCLVKVNQDKAIIGWVEQRFLASYQLE
jgi:hypothetical protein